MCLTLLLAYLQLDALLLPGTQCETQNTSSVLGREFSRRQHTHQLDTGLNLTQILVMCALCAGGDGNLLRAKDSGRKRQHRLRWLLPDQLQPLHVCALSPRPNSRSSISICAKPCGTGKLEAQRRKFRLLHPKTRAVTLAL